MPPMSSLYNIQKLSDKAKKDNILPKLISKIRKELSIIPIIGVEIEFYLQDDNISNAPLELKKEKGKFQYEIDLPPSDDIIDYISRINTAKNLLTEWRDDINFSPKPYLDDYGNSMHLHVNFLTNKGMNFFDNIDNINIAASSLCHYLLQHLLVFANTQDSYLRFDHKFMAPSHICFGSNNRSVAVRIPESGSKRLEHRVSSPVTDPYLAIFAILQGIYLGLKEPSHINKYVKIYGNAFDSQYNLEKLPENIEIAAKYFNFKILSDG